MPKKHSSKDQKQDSRTYLIRIHGDGGQFMVGRVPEKYAKFWAHRNPNELRVHVESRGDGRLGDDEVYESPDISRNVRLALPEEIANIFNDLLVYGDARIHLQEVQLLPNNQLPIIVGDPIVLALPAGKKRRVVLDYKLTRRGSKVKKSAQMTPVLSAIYRVSGDILRGSITTKTPFDPRLMTVNMVNTSFGSLMIDFLYDGKVIPLIFHESGVKFDVNDMYVGWIKQSPSKRARQS